MTQEPEKHRLLAKDASPAVVLGKAAELLNNGIDVCIATVVGSEGSTPSTPGQKLLIGDDHTALGTIGGGAVEREAVDHMRELISSGETAPESRWYTLTQDLAMACGGRVQLMFEPMSSATSVLLVGAGHIGFALATLLPRVATTPSSGREIGCGRPTSVRPGELRTWLWRPILSPLST